MKKIVLVLSLLFAGALMAQEAQEFAQLLKDNKQVIARAYKTQKALALPLNQCLSASSTGIKSYYLFLSCYDQGIEVMFGFRCNRYVHDLWGHVPGLIYVYLCGPDPSSPTRLFYANKHLKGMFLVADDANGTFQVPILQGNFSRMNDVQKAGFVETIKAVIDAAK